MTSFESIGVNLWFYSPDHGQLFEDLAYRAPRSGEAPGRGSADIPIVDFGFEAQSVVLPPPINNQQLTIP